MRYSASERAYHRYRISHWFEIESEKLWKAMKECSGITEFSLGSSSDF